MTQYGLHNNTEPNVSKERNAIYKLREFYLAINNSGLGSFWEDVIEEIFINNLKELVRKKQNDEYIDSSWFEHESTLNNILTIVSVEGNRYDYNNYVNLKELLENVYSKEALAG